ESAHLVQAQRTDVDLFARDAEVLHECLGVATRARGRAEARHGEGVDICTGHAQSVEGLARNEQRQGGIEAAADADRGGGLADVVEAFGEAGDLSLKYLLAALAKLLLAARHERVGLHFAQEPWRLLRPLEYKRDTPKHMARRIAALTEVVCANTVRE